MLAHDCVGRCHGGQFTASTSSSRPFSMPAGQRPFGSAQVRSAQPAQRRRDWQPFSRLRQKHRERGRGRRRMRPQLRHPAESRRDEEDQQDRN